MLTISEALLTDVLTRSGALTHGEVIAVSQSPAGFESILSTILTLEIRYSTDAAGDAPDRCLIKLVEGEQFAIGRAEVEFYRFASAEQPPGLTRCYGTHIDEALETAFVLMDEQRGPFVRSEWPIPPDHGTFAAAASVLAEFHASWWGSDVAARIGAHRILPQADPERLRPRMTALFDQVGDGLSPGRRALIERLVAAYPGLHAARLAASGRQTIVHGDAHIWNFLVPLDGQRAPVIIDWQLWGVDFGAADIAYMMALHWFSERRSRFEQGLVRTWAETIASRGFEYSFDAAWTDYRFLVAGLLPRVVVYSAVIPASIWWPHLERAFLAYEDLQCAELIGP